MKQLKKLEIYLSVFILTVSLAHAEDKGEIISADSRQVYVGMDIGTGKDLSKSAVWHKGKGNIPGYYSLYVVGN